jgi:hypothetical protein
LEIYWEEIMGANESYTSFPCIFRTELPSVLAGLQASAMQGKSELLNLHGDINALEKYAYFGIDLATQNGSQVSRSRNLLTLFLTVRR